MPVLNGKLIRGLREADGLTQDDLLAICDVEISKRTLHTAEKGEKSVSTLVYRTLAKALGVNPPDQLLAKSSVALEAVKRARPVVLRDDRAVVIAVRPPGSALFNDLRAVTDRLERLLLPLKRSVGDHWLREPKDQRWFPFRPGSVAEIELEAWGPQSGNWQDAVWELGWCDGGIGSEEYKPQLIYCSPDGYLFDALIDPTTDRDTRNMTLDGLLYVRDNVPRLLRVIQKRIDLLHAHGLVSNHPLLTTQLRQLEREYRHAGAGHGQK